MKRLKFKHLSQWTGRSGISSITHDPDEKTYWSSSQAKREHSSGLMREHVRASHRAPEVDYVGIMLERCSRRSYGA